MPTDYIKSLAGKGFGSVQSLEKKWEDAKSKAAAQSRGDNYALITHIFKQMIGARLEAKSRLMSTAEEDYKRQLSEEMLGDHSSMPEVEGPSLAERLVKPGLPARS